MTKRKKRQDDFQKVKLKVGKKKPRPDNATSVSFRSKSIHLSEQLRRDESGPTTHRQLGIKDLLSQLHHYNATVKQGALFGLRELLASHTPLVHQHLSTILSEVAAAFTDKDGVVRRAALRLLRFVAQCVPGEHVAPFFPLLSAHLTCAMTHISSGIQADALLVLDVLLEHYPALLAHRHAHLLTNFLELISQQKLGGGAKAQAKPGAGKTWALSITPERRTTAQQWRLTVLLRLSRFLEAVVEERAGEGGVVSADKVTADKCLVTPLELNWEEQPFGKGGVQVFENSGAKPTPHSTYRLRPDLEPGAGVDSVLGSLEAVRGFAETLVPLLMEVWVETVGADSGHLISDDAMALMQQVLTVLQLLRRLTPQHHLQEELDSWLRTSYLRDFRQHFMKNFPYSLLDTPIQRHKKKGEGKRTRQQVMGGSVASGNADPLGLNVTLCQVMVTLSVKGRGQPEGQDADWLGPIRSFVRETLMDGGRLGGRQLAPLLEVVWRLVLNQKSRTVTEELLQAVHAQYHQRNLSVSVRLMLLRFFSRLYLQEHLSRSKILARWLASLPVQLVQLGSRNPQLSAQILQTLQSAAAWRNKDLLQSLQTQACSLYDPVQGCVVVLPADSQQRLVQMLYFLPAFPPDLLACLSRICNTGRVSASLAATLIRIIHLRSSLSGWQCSSQEVAVRDVDYFSFLFSTLMGFCQDEITELQQREDESIALPSSFSPFSIYSTPEEQFTHHWDVVEVSEVCHCLETLGSRSQCFDLLQNGVYKTLVGLTVVPDSVCAAVLRFVSRLLDVNVIPNETLLNFLSNCCLSMLSLFLQLEPGTHRREAVWGACLAALSTVPRLLRLVLQALRVGDLCEEEFPQVAQILQLLMQHTHLRNHMIANNALLQQIIQELTYSVESRDQWLTDLLYCYSTTVSSHRGNLF
uniref:Pre-rRNA-processing protein Ipi1 N-terminal domain-containing protein n=1 Tax=Denticeps clupeoides TaxID=299321 RepID=A0AAY4DRT0_9TELE